ncbi:hypothetical protein Tco_0448716 [Tanacetum coccineum]
MSTPVFVDPESLFGWDDTESEPFESMLRLDTLSHPSTVSTPTSLHESTLPYFGSYYSRTASMAYAAFTCVSPGLFARLGRVEDDEEEDGEIEESLNSDCVSEDAQDEGPTAEDEDPDAGDEGHAARDEGPGMGVESHGLDDEGRGLDDKSRALDDEGHSVESDGLGLREEEEAVPQGPSKQAVLVWGQFTFEVRQGSGSAPEPERPERVSASRQPTLTTWTDPEDDMVYIDVPAYPPLAPPIQTLPSPEWSSSSLPISPSPSIVPSPISSTMIPLTVPSPVATPVTAETEGFLIELGAQVKMQEGLICDHAVRLEELSPALFERSLKHEQKRVAVTFGALWRPVLALESWSGQTDAQRAALWHAINDTQGENQDLRLQLAEERRARLELAEIVDSMRRGQ